MESELEHLMILEAIHLSLLEQDRQQQKKQDSAGPVGVAPPGTTPPSVAAQILRHRERATSDGQPSSSSLSHGSPLDYHSPLGAELSDSDSSSDDEPLSRSPATRTGTDDFF